MTVPSDIYKPSLALLTDFYELTMAYAYWKSGIADHESVFHLFFRRNPFEGGYTVACGLSDVIDYLEHFRLDNSDLTYLEHLKGNDEKPLFEPRFLEYLSTLKFDCDVDAVEEGTVVFPHEPLVRVKGPIIPCQILETPLLNTINFQSLIATKASRVCLACENATVLEFGLRRAHGIDGSLAASRAAYIGGCHATSNVLAGKLYGIPVKGTHAHSWVMAFDSERDAFSAYAKAMPNNCTLLVDTYNTLDGVRNAVTVAEELRQSGHDLTGVRLDSGDLAYLSIESRKILDEHGCTNTQIVASNDLDERIIASLKAQGARIDVWGVGTKLITAYDQPALGGVYKLSAVRAPNEPWQYKVKLSEQVTKISTPGILQIRRFTEKNLFSGDAIYDESHGLPEPCTIVDPADATRRKKFSQKQPWEDLLIPIFRRGERVYTTPAIDRSRQRVADQLTRCHAGIKRFINPHQYPVGLEATLHRIKTDLILQARERHLSDLS